MMRPDQPGRLQALVSLLSDESPRVVAEARRVLRKYGADALPALAEAIAAPDARLRARARLARDEVRLALLEDELRAIAPRLDRDPRALEDGAILLARTRDHDLDPATVHAALDAMADDLGTRLEGERSPVAVVARMTRFLARELGFQGNQRNYYDPDNSYIDRVLQRRTGIPITLSTIYMFVARRLRIPLVGIGMPGHFLLRHAGAEPALFIDPFGGGRVLSENDCLRYLEEGEFGYDPSDLLPMTDGAILLRMIRNLTLIYRNRGDLRRRDVLMRLKRLLVGDEAPDPEVKEADGERGSDR
jgi:regulator of sirC expression with transglutaminase-like and TPR domain